MTNQGSNAARKSISAAQRKKDPHAGPHGSFPLDADHLKAAWDLAGHAANPDAVRAKVIAYAKAHGMEKLLPADAQAHMQKVAKAKSGDMHDLLHTAYHMSEPHSWEREHLLRLAASKGLLHHLPEEAHTDLHEFHIRHNHPNMNDGILPRLNGENEGDIQEDPDDPAYPLFHEHQVVKARGAGKATFGLIQKSWSEEGSEDLLIEGWLTTPRRDLEKDITEPEAFVGGPLQDYFERSAPLSLEHGTNTLPAGHLQKAAIMRDGKVLETAAHPSDAADFTALPSSGTASGVWVRARITEEPAKGAVKKGNVGGMSFIGYYTQYTPLPGGGKRYQRFDPLVESTIAAYPVNPEAAMKRVQKALGLPDAPEPVQETPHMTEDFDFDAFMAQAAEKAAEKRQADEANQAQKAITLEGLGAVLDAFQTKLLASVDEKVTKAFSEIVPERGEGVGRKGTAPAAETPDAFEADPLAYLIQKSQDGKELTTREKEVAGKLWKEVLSTGMSFASDED